MWEQRRRWESTPSYLAWYSEIDVSMSPCPMVHMGFPVGEILMAHLDKWSEWKVEK